jgi:hypothetical protein
MASASFPAPAACAVRRTKLTASFSLLSPHIRGGPMRRQLQIDSDFGTQWVCISASIRIATATFKWRLEPRIAPFHGMRGAILWPRRREFRRPNGARGASRFRIPGLNTLHNLIHAIADGRVAATEGGSSHTGPRPTEEDDAAHNAGFLPTGISVSIRAARRGKIDDQARWI